LRVKTLILSRVQGFFGSRVFGVICRVSGVVLICLGIIRMFSLATIPSFRLIEIGVAAIVFPSLPVSKGSFKILRDGRFLWVIVAASFIFKVVWEIIFQSPTYGSNPYYLSTIEKFDADPSLLLRSWRPVPFFLMLALYRTGLSFTYILWFLIPVFSALTIVPFYFLVKNLSDVETASLASLFLAFAPLQMYMLQDILYENAIGNFFLILALYFCFNEKGKFPVRSVISAIALFLSHILPFVIFIASLIVYCLTNRWTGRTRRILLILSATTVFFVAALIFGSWGLLATITKTFLSPRFNSVEVMLAEMYSLRHVFIPSLTLSVAAFSLVFAKRSSGRGGFGLMACMLAGLALLSLPLVLKADYSKFWWFVRLWFHVEFPIAFYAARTGLQSVRGRYAIVVVFLLVLTDSLTIVSRYWYG